MEPVGHVEDGAAKLLEPAHDRVQVGDLLDGERDARLVENEQARVVVEGAGDHHQPLLHDGQAREVGARVDRRVQLRQDVAHPPAQLAIVDERAQASREGRSDRDVLRHRQQREVPELLMDEGEPETMGDPGRIPHRRRRAVDEERSRVEVLDPGEDLDQRALAGPVLTDEADDLAGAEREVDAVERVDACVAFDGSTNLDDRRALLDLLHSRPPTCDVPECNMLVWVGGAHGIEPAGGSRRAGT